MSRISNLEHVLMEVNAFLKEINVVEKEKFNAAINNRVFDIEEIMKKEQALLLKMRGLDRKREAALKELGFENMTFEQVMETIPDNQKGSLQDLFSEMKIQYSYYIEISQSARRALEDNIHRIDLIIAKHNGDKGRNTIYALDGSVVQNQSCFTSKRV